MTTCRDIIERAFRKLGTTAVGEAISANEASDGLEALNFMLAGMELDGVYIAHTDRALDDAFPMPDRFREGITYMLAARLSSEYEAPPTFDADDFLRKLQAAYTVADEVAMPFELLVPPIRRRRLR